MGGGVMGGKKINQEVDRYELARTLAAHTSRISAEAAEKQGLPVLAVAVVAVLGEPLNLGDDGKHDIYLEGHSVCAQGMATGVVQKLGEALSAVTESGDYLRAMVDEKPL